MQAVPRDEWQRRAADHAARVDAWVTDRLERRRTGRHHPVEDFLFDYYPYSAGRLRRWHPGPGVALEGRADEVLRVPGFIERDGMTVFESAALPANVHAHLAKDLPWTLRLLQAVSQRPGGFGCFGLHEWAMVLGSDPEEVRHSSWPLRVGPDVIRRTIEEVGLRCTHIDAFRFFTDEARPLNPATLSRSTQPDDDRPGCLHATMDLYKWAMRMQPLVPMDLVADAFALARDVRVLDMQGAPYDLATLGVDPLPLETTEGRAEFARRQRAHAERATPLRERLIAALDPWQPLLSA